ncbi:MAG: caspase family protein [Planctomycetes bacterium]|nr:caspase family protein [Planctomycetota bacterium]
MKIASRTLGRAALATLVVATTALTRPFQTETARRKPTRHALLIGCTEYPELAKAFDRATYEQRIRLAGPANDVESIREVLTTRFGFATDPRDAASEITVLSGWPADAAARPTAANIRAALDRLAVLDTRAELVFVFFAGHGSQVPDRDGDEPDGLDEALMPADVRTIEANARGEIPNALTDDELGRRLEAIAKHTDKLVFVADACHSGSTLRGAPFGVRTRNLAPELLGVDVPHTRGAQGGDERPTRADGRALANVVCLYGAKSYQLAPELALPAQSDGALPHGVFTFALASELHDAKADLSWRELYSRLVCRYRVLWNAASPDIEGSLDSAVFGTGFVAPEIRLRQDKNELVLEGGALHDLTNGDVLAYFDPDAPKETRTPLGYVTIEKAGLSISTCKPCDAEGRAATTAKLTKRYPTSLVQRSVGASSLPIAVVDGDGKALPREAWPEEWKRLFEPASDDAAQRRQALFPLATSLTEARCIVHVDDGVVALEPFGGAGTVPRFTLSSSSAGALDDGLRSIARVQALLRFVDARIARPLDERVRIACEVDGGAGFAPLQSGATFVPGAPVRMTIENRSGADQFVFLFLVDGSYGVTQIFPTGMSDGGVFDFHPNAKVEASDGPIVSKDDVRFDDSTSGNEYLLAIVIPAAGAKSVPNLDFLAGAKLRAVRKPSSEMEQVLLDLCDGGGVTRGITSKGAALNDASMGLIAWRTSWGNVGLRGTPRLVVPAAAQPDGARVRELPSPVPDPWAVGETVAWTATTETPDALVLCATDDAALPEAQRRRWLLIDVDGDSKWPTAEAERSAWLARGGFDAELALYFAPERDLACYDLDGEHGFDRVLVDRDGDRLADEQFELRNGVWTTTANPNKPWLQTSAFDDGALREAATKKLRRLMVE